MLRLAWTGHLSNEKGLTENSNDTDIHNQKEKFLRDALRKEGLVNLKLTENIEGKLT